MDHVLIKDTDDTMAQHAEAGLVDFVDTLDPVTKEKLLEGMPEKPAKETASKQKLAANVNR
jgi:hypothetical protein